MTEVKEVQSEITSQLTYADKVIEKIVGKAIAPVEGLLTVTGGFFSNLKDKVLNSDDITDGIKVEVGKKQVAVDLDIIAEYQKHLPTLFEELKSVIQKDVKRMTDLTVVQVNVNVVDIKTKEQHELDSLSFQEKLSGVMSTTAENSTDKSSQDVDRKRPRVI